MPVQRREPDLGKVHAGVPHQRAIAVDPQAVAQVEAVLRRMQARRAFRPQGDAADEATLHAAEEVYNHLLARVKDFQSTLPERYELGIRLGNFGGERAVHVRGMGYRNPNIIEFYGLLDGDKQVAVVQHVSQLNFMLLAVPPVAEQPPYRIGFAADI